MNRTVMAVPSFVRRTPLRTERGASAVEFALVLPVLLLVVFGIIAYGFVFAAQLNMNSAARDASRSGVVQPMAGSAMTCQAIATQAKNASNTIGLAPSKVSVKVSSPSVSGQPYCNVAANGTVTSSPSAFATAQACTSATQTGQLVVVITYANVKVPVPLVPVPSNLTATGSFQCEYS
jgi:Flp pilus assembly protein TadG